jgi:hypothetical protein
MCRPERSEGHAQIKWKVKSEKWKVKSENEKWKVKSGKRKVI